MAACVNLPVAGVIENMSWFVAPDTGARYEVFAGGAARFSPPSWVPLLAQVPLEPAVARSGTPACPWWRPIRRARRGAGADRGRRGPGGGRPRVGGALLTPAPLAAFPLRDPTTPRIAE